MSHSHEDRVADRPANLCAAYGCPLQGTMTTSPGAGADWWCCCHFGQNVGVMQAITSEINRLGHVHRAINEIRAGFGRPYGDWAQIVRAIGIELTAAKREDLCPIRGERARDWMVRLETDLLASCKPFMNAAAPLQKVLISQPDSSWNHLQFDIPEQA